MSKLIRRIAAFLEGGAGSPEDLAKQATAAKRAAGDILCQGDRIAACLTHQERQTLNEAAAILQAAHEAARNESRQRKLRNQAFKRRRVAAFKAVEQAFADVTDAGGLIAMLATAGSWRTAQDAAGNYVHGRWLRDEDPSYDVREIQNHERREALEHYAWRIASDNDKDVTTEAKALRAKFQEIRAKVEAKHQKLIQFLADKMTTKE